MRKYGSEIASGMLIVSALVLIWVANHEETIGWSILGILFLIFLINYWGDVLLNKLPKTEYLWKLYKIIYLIVEGGVLIILGMSQSVWIFTLWGVLLTGGLMFLALGIHATYKKERK